ncbi:MAG: hypothetical protein K0U37_03885 [Gammaproteobacteria bacterium]|nr:hypothetical protein [Gammaproteobacteria bacterium]
MLKRILSAQALLFVSYTYAGIPLWTFEALTPTAVSLPYNSTVTVQYKVTNQSTSTHFLNLIHMQGVKQITGPGNCPEKFSLDGGAFCFLTLEIHGNELPHDLTTGPYICDVQSTLQCYGPSQANSLNINIKPAVPYATLSVTNAPVPVYNGGMPTQIHIKNTSTNKVAKNIGIDFSATSLAPYISIPTNTCDTVEPQAECIITMKDTLHSRPGIKAISVTPTVQSSDGSTEAIQFTTTQYSVGDAYGTDSIVACVDPSNPLQNLVMFNKRFGPEIFLFTKGKTIALEPFPADLENGLQNFQTMQALSGVVLEAPQQCNNMGEVDGQQSFLPAQKQLSCLLANGFAGSVSIDDGIWTSSIFVDITDINYNTYYAEYENPTHFQFEVQTISPWRSIEKDFYCTHALPPS